jgi:hypothetical protein
MRTGNEGTSFALPKALRQQAGLLIRADGTETEVTPADTEFTLEELQVLVGGYIELVSTRDGLQMYVNEEGLVLDLPINVKASGLIAPKYWTVDGVRGDAVVITRGQVA